MQNIVKVVFVSSLLGALVYGDDITQMFVNGKESGDLRFLYAGKSQKEIGAVNFYSSVVGGSLKYELAEYSGFSGSAEFVTAYDIPFASGDRSKEKNYAEVSSSNGYYTTLSQAYLNYKYDGLNLRVGRQVLETPLANNDDRMMIQNTFEAYMATYEINSFTLTAGNLQNYQGVDVGLDTGWSNPTGEDGTWFGGVTYKDAIEANAWYYNISKLLNAVYIDMSMEYQLNDAIAVGAGVQYLNQRELENSGSEANIYGAVAGLSVYDLGFSVAYDKSIKVAGKASFSGFGGGCMYTSMDTMIIDVITEDRDADALLAGVSYAVFDFTLSYNYGNFVGDKNSVGDKAHIIEQDIGGQYTFNENLLASVFYIISNDEESSIKTSYDWNRVQATVRYSF